MGLLCASCTEFRGPNAYFIVPTRHGLSPTNVLVTDPKAGLHPRGGCGCRLYKPSHTLSCQLLKAPSFADLICNLWSHRTMTLYLHLTFTQVHSNVRLMSSETVLPCVKVQVGCDSLSCTPTAYFNIPELDNWGQL